MGDRDIPDVPPEVWARFEQLVKINFAPSRLYIASQKKRAFLEALDRSSFTTASPAADPLRFAPRRFHKTGLRVLLSLLQPVRQEARRVIGNSPDDLPRGISPRRAEQLRRLK